MKKILMAIFGVGVLVFGMTGMANATLLTIGTADYMGGTYKLIWDDDNNSNSVVWLDYSKSQDIWENQKSWAASLNGAGVISINLSSGYSINWGANLWRLPATVDGLYEWGYDGNTTAGFNITTSELGYLFYEALLNIGKFNTNGTQNPLPPAPNHFLQNTGDFDNLIAFSYAKYWSVTEFGSNTSEAWVFQTYDGDQYNLGKIYDGYGIAIRNAEVSYAPIPEPTTLLLLGTGLVGVAGAVRRRKKK